MKIEIYKSGTIRKSWKWKMIADNGRIVASGRGFNSERLAKESVKLILMTIRTERIKIESIKEKGKRIKTLI